MSRCYRIRQSIRITDKQTRDVCTSDEVCTEIELLEILPGEDMSSLLRRELENHGFTDDDGKLKRTRDNITVCVDLTTDHVTIGIADAATIEAEVATMAESDDGPTAAQLAQLRHRLRQELDEKLEQHEGDWHRKVSGQLEAQLGDLSAELDTIVNRVTAEALKQKAAQLGQIREITEDPEAGTLTIKVEV